MRSNIAVLIIITVSVLLASTGCQAPEESDVVAEVGGKVITYQMLAEYPMSRQALDSMITDHVVLTECYKRGIVLDAKAYEEGLTQAMMQAGGKEMMEEWLESEGVTWSVIFNYVKMPILKNQLIEEFATEPTEEEIEALWLERKEQWVASFAYNLGIDESEVTIDDAREEIINELKGKERQELQMTLFDKLKVKYNVKNYLSGEGLDEEDGESEEAEEEDEGNLALLDLVDVGNTENEDEEEHEEDHEEDH